MPVDVGPIVQKRFGKEYHHLSEFVTPTNQMVVDLFHEIAGGLTEEDAIIKCWDWVCRNIRYPINCWGYPTDYHAMSAFAIGWGFYKLRGVNSRDFFSFPAETLGWVDSSGRRWGDCEDKSFLLASLLRNILPPERVHVVFGDYVADDKQYGHAWVQVKNGGEEYILETTWSFIPFTTPWVCNAGEYTEYVPVIMFNDIPSEYVKLSQT